MLRLLPPRRLWYKTGITFWKEMPMCQRHRRSRRTNQPDLFSPPPVLPTWRCLPPEVQRQLRQLLAKLLWSDPTNPRTEAGPKEVADE